MSMPASAKAPSSTQVADDIARESGKTTSDSQSAGSAAAWRSGGAIAGYTCAAATVILGAIAVVLKRRKGRSGFSPGSPAPKPQAGDDSEMHSNPGAELPIHVSDANAL